MPYRNKTFLFLASYDISKIDPDQDHKIEDKLQGVVVADNGTVLIADYSEHPIIKGKMLYHEEFFWLEIHTMTSINSALKN